VVLDNDMSPSDMLVKLLSSLVHETCWSITCCGAAGSTLMVDMGREVPRDRPIANPTLSDRQRVFEGEYRLFIECSWRLELNSLVLSGSGDDISPNGSMANSIKEIQGRSVSGVEVQPPAWDLRVSFVDGLVLKVFCDQTDIEEDDLNYSVSAGSTTVLVGPRGHIAIERRSLD
jgi:hypothetical protein